MIYKLMLALGVSLALLVGGSWLWRSGSAKTAQARGAAAAAPAAAPLVVEVHEVAPEPLEVQVTATGTLLGRESVELVSELSRRLVKVHAEEGRRVRKGAVLFELDAADLHAELAKVEVQARLARATLERTERLQAEGLSNQQELDLARARVDEAAAERQALRVTLDKTLIRAPFDGTLGLRRVSEGAWLTPATVLSTLHDTSDLKLDFTLPERYAGAIQRGGPFRFRVEGRPETFSGEVVALEPSVDAATRSLVVRGRLTEGTDLLPGAAAQVELPLRVEQALLVPAITIIPGVQGRQVYVHRDGRAQPVAVEVGFRTADRAQIVSGLEAGDQVITTNLLRLRAGAPVRLSPKAGEP